MRLLPALAAVIILSPNLPSAAESDRWQSEMATGDAAYNAGRYPDASVHYEAAIKDALKNKCADCDKVKIYKAIALACAPQVERRDTCIESYERALQLADKTPQVSLQERLQLLYGLAAVYGRYKKFDDAEALLNKGKILDGQLLAMKPPVSRECLKKIADLINRVSVCFAFDRDKTLAARPWIEEADRLRNFDR